MDNPRESGNKTNTNKAKTHHYMQPNTNNINKPSYKQLEVKTKTNTVGGIIYVICVCVRLYLQLFVGGLFYVICVCFSLYLQLFVGGLIYVICVCFSFYFQLFVGGLIYVICVCGRTQTQIT
jgi:hypothetical protein